VKNNRKVIMVDMDGTLSDSRWRNKFSPANGGSWDEFHKSCNLDRPIGHNVKLVQKWSEHYEIIISTARPFYTVPKTSWWLDQNIVKHNTICSRQANQMRMASPVLKLAHADMIKRLGKEIAFIFDDRRDVCQAFLAAGMGACCAINIQPQEEVELVKKTPDEILSEAGHFFKQRNEEYGDAWKKHGAIMKSNFPDGITLETEEEFFMYHCLVMDVVKTTRICNAMAGGNQHEDSWKDKMVYAAMAKSQIKEN